MRDTVKWHLRPLGKLIRSLEREVVSGTVRKQWAVRYSAFVRKRFAREGDGTWAPLASSTLMKRRKQGKGAKILRDTGTLLNALSVGARGNLVKRIRKGVRFGFSSTLHPSGNKSMRKIAEYLSKKRPILVPPDDATVTGMKNDLMKDVEKRGRRYGGRAHV